MVTNLPIGHQIEQLYCRFTRETTEGIETGICLFKNKELVGNIWDMYYFKRLGDLDMILEVSESWMGTTHNFEPISFKDLKQEIKQMKLGLENSIKELANTIDRLRTENKKIEVPFFEKTLCMFQACNSELLESEEWVNGLHLNDMDYVPVREKQRF
ncbi:MAG TPA: hypothetical protein PLQ20_03115 [Candidatus Paceibacterota bacterium]|nr:hypothetical protein [Candidatus Paceibacterota bacterium]